MHKNPNKAELTIQIKKNDIENIIKDKGNSFGPIFRLYNSCKRNENLNIYKQDFFSS